MRCFAAIIILIAAATPVAATAATLFETPVYNSETKSYFELIPVRDARGSLQTSKTLLWHQVDRLARSRTYKGAKGRLAVVKTATVRDFLLTTFRSDRVAWIGLRYACDQRALHWSDGSQLGAKDYKVWDPQWNNNPGACTDSDLIHRFLGVAFSPAASGFRWIAFGFNKGENRYFVEYPTGGP